MTKERLRILVACECSGVVRDAFIAAGHDAVSCDLLPSDSAGPHLMTDVSKVLYDGWDMMVAHPPCTYLTTSAEWLYRDQQDKNIAPTTLTGLNRRAAREQAIDFAIMLYSSPIPRVALENPVGVLSTAFRKPDQYIQPYNFGEDASKRTGLWLKGLPRLRPTKYVHPRLVCCGLELADDDYLGCQVCGGTYVPKARWGNQTQAGQNRLSSSLSQSKKRSVTYKGIAKAMAEQWGEIR